MQHSLGATTIPYATSLDRSPERLRRAALAYDLRVQTPGREPLASYHTGVVTDFLRRHRFEAEVAAHADKQTRANFVGELFSRVADTRNLYAAFAHVRARGGDAPGVDGLRPSAVDAEGGWEMVRVIRATLFDGTYRPARLRRKRILKTSGTGTRTLSIPTLVDRVVQRALVQVVEPYLDPHFADDSFGFRRRRGRLQALARAHWYTAQQDRPVWVTEDLKDAFNHVPQKRLLDVVRLHLPDDRLMKLIELLVATPTGRGVSQGGPASGLWLNIYLDHFLDREWRKRELDVPLVRVADDLLLLCRDTNEARRVYGVLAEILRPTGMVLKGTPQSTIRDLAAGQVVEWLGYRINYIDGRLKYDVADRAWRSLANKLTLAHEQPIAPLAALATLDGWVSQIGPTYAPAKVPATYDRVRRLARSLGYEEIPSTRDLHAAWRRAHGAWEDALGAEYCGRSAATTGTPTQEDTPVK